ncbi:MAG: RidA family protein [Dethiobacteria bacterium]|nr:RidA family protein [Bacillota bacterium]
MAHEYVNTEHAPGAVGPYSQAVKVGSMVFVSGQLPLDPASGEMVGADAATQAAQCMKNILAILETEWLNASDIIKATIYLKNMSDFASVNEVYATFFNGKYPARVCIEVAGLPKDALVEIDAVASS